MVTGIDLFCIFAPEKNTKSLGKLNGILILFLFLFIGILPVWGDGAADPFVLVIDPGHGGSDPGAQGEQANEKDINLAVAKLAGYYISREHPDVKIIYTRRKDVKIGLKQRTDMANRSKANLFISIHSNSNEKNSFSGAEVYILGLHRTEANLKVAQRENNVILLEDDYKQTYEGFDPQSAESYIIFELMQNHYQKQSLQLATLIQKELTTTAQRKDNGVRQAGFWVLVGASMPSVLVELDYISNKTTEKFLSDPDGQAKLARSISNAFSEYKKDYDTKRKQVTKVASSGEEIQANTQKTVSVATAPAKEIIYKVQILTASTKLPAGSRFFKGHKTDFYIENNTYKYTCGESSDYNEIVRMRQSLLKDFKDAFIVKFENGIKTPNK
jgi:N-acetylmuramoyl-L-alanine amidase